MEGIIEVLHLILTDAVEICTVMMEFAGMIVLVTTAVKCFYHWLKHSDRNIRLDLGEGIALALEFKLGGEVLRTVVVREWSELGILGAIIVLRAALTFLIHWEISEEKKQEEKKEEEKKSRKSDKNDEK